MPNWVKNKLTINNRVDEIFSFIKCKDTIFDFNKIIPMPESLHIEDSSTGDEGMKYLYLKATSFLKYEIQEIEDRLKQRGQFDSAIELGKKYLFNIANTGHKTWYDWSSENWGTNWNACEPTILENCIIFDTAWNGIVKLIEKLSKYFPDVTFEYKYSDEDTGCNCGYGMIINGISSMTYLKNGSREAYELAFELRPDYVEYYNFENGNYVSVEEDE